MMSGISSAGRNARAGLAIILAILFVSAASVAHGSSRTPAWSEQPLGGPRALTPREGHSAIWTGSEMIIWGGGITSGNTGARYSPVTDTWTDVSNAGAPALRRDHLAA